MPVMSADGRDVLYENTCPKLKNCDKIQAALVVDPINGEHYQFWSELEKVCAKCPEGVGGVS